jgi:hypothetical protein
MMKKPIWKLKDWISEDYCINWLCNNKHPRAIEILEEVDKNSINWYSVSANPNAFDFQMKNYNKIHWSGICINPNPSAYELILKNQDKIDWPYLSSNPNAIELLEKNMDKVDIYSIYSNPKAIPLIKKFAKKTRKKYGKFIGSNPSEEAIPLIMSNLHIYRKNKMCHIVENPFAIDIIIDNLDYMTHHDWKSLALNPHPEAIELLKANFPIDECLYNLVNNPSPEAFKLLEGFKKEVLKRSYLNDELYKNPNIFEYDYLQMKKNNEGLEEELITYIMEPSRVFRNGGLSYLNDLFR